MKLDEIQKRILKFVEMKAQTSNPEKIKRINARLKKQRDVASK